MEIVVDAYTPEEQAMGWYYSLEDRLHCPFVARCIAERSISPLRVGDQVDVVAMAPEEECHRASPNEVTSPSMVDPLRHNESACGLAVTPFSEALQHEMFVLIRWERRALAVPLAQLEGVAVDEQTRQVIEDWQYWVAQGYEL
jgi:hypothetical protein